MAESNLIATLIPLDGKRLAENAFRLNYNEARHLPPSDEIRAGSVISSREATPAGEARNDDDDHCKYDFAHRLQLTFEKKPKDPTKGFSFGTNEKVCDVVLGERGTRGISGLHFCITFGVDYNGRTCLMLKDSSTNGMAVSYGDQAEYEVRHHFTWILDLKDEKGKWEIRVHVRGLEFKVELASHETGNADYDKNMKEFLEASRPALPSLDVLGIYSHATTAQDSQALTPRRRPIYISERQLGSGSFGKVDKVFNVSTGAIYARKKFYEPQWARGQEERRKQKEDWLHQVGREIRIMRENPHVSMITQWIGWQV